MALTLRLTSHCQTRQTDTTTVSQIQRCASLALADTLPPRMTEVGWRRCPRCNAEVFEVGRGAVSRTTRDYGADVETCGRCGSREATYGYDGAGLPPLTDW